MEDRRLSVKSNGHHFKECFFPIDEGTSLHLQTVHFHLAASVSSRQRFPLDHRLFIIKRPLADLPPDFSDLMTFRSGEPGLTAHPDSTLSFCLNSSRSSLVFITNSRTWEWNSPCPPWNIDERSATKIGTGRPESFGPHCLVLPCLAVVGQWLLC